MNASTSPGLVHRVFIIARWLPGVTARTLRGDLAAGLTVGVMLIPQSMAYAVLAGVPPIYGLYASLVPLLVYPLFGTARHLATGVVAIDMLIVAAALAPLAERGSPRYVALALLLAALVGMLQIFMGLARMGFLVNLLSRPVISGFTSAAALIIGFSQLENLLGLALPDTQHVHVLVWEAASGIEHVHLISLALGAGGILVLAGLGRWKPTFPGALAVVAASTVLAWALRLDRSGVAVVGAVPTGLPAPGWPAGSLSAAWSLVPTALTLALVQFMNVISLGKAFAARHRYEIRANRELFAVGCANLVGSLFKSLPVSGSFSRTAVSERAGAHTPLANVVAAGLVGLTLLFLTPLFAYLPVPTLAALIMVAAFGLLDLRELRYLWKVKKVDGGVAVLTFAATLLISIQAGILIGIGASVVAVMFRISRPHVAVLGHLPGTRSFRDVRHFRHARPIEGILMLRIDASFSFANADFLKDHLLKRTQVGTGDIRAVLLDASSVNDLDTTAIAVLRSAAQTLRERGIELYFGGVKEAVLQLIVRSGLYLTLGADHFFLTPHRAVVHILAQEGRSAEYLGERPGAAPSGSASAS